MCLYASSRAGSGNPFSGRFGLELLAVLGPGLAQATNFDIFLNNFSVESA